MGEFFLIHASLPVLIELDVRELTVSSRHTSLALFIGADYHNFTSEHEGPFQCQQKLKTNGLSENNLDKALSCLQNDF